MDMLEQVNGGRITNKQQARGAARSVDNMRNAAEFAGMDPKQAMQMLGAQQEGFKEMLKNSLKIDDRSEQETTKAAAEMANKIMPKAIEASKLGSEANKTFDDLGISGFDKESKSAQAIALDAAMMKKETMDMFTGQSVANSDMVGLKTPAKKRIKELAAESMALDTSTDEGARAQQSIEQEIRTTIETDTGKTMDQYLQSGNGRANVLQGSSSDAMDRFTNKHARESLVRSGNLNNALEGTDLTDDEKAELNRSVLDDLGGKTGLADLAKINSMDNEEERTAHLDAFFKDRNIGDDTRKLYERSLTSVSDEGTTNALEGANMTDAEKVTLNRSVLNDLGGKTGLADLEKINSIENEEERATQLDTFFKDKDIGDDKRKLYEKSMIGDSGEIKKRMSSYTQILDKKERMGEYARAVNNENYAGDYGSKNLDRESANNRLSNMKNNKDRVRMTDENKKITGNSIASAMFKGDVQDPFANADTATATLQALQSAGVSMEVEDEEIGVDGKSKKVKRDLTKMYTGGMDISKGFNSEMLDKVDTVAGKKVNLLDRVNKSMGTKMTRDEFLEKSKTDVKLRDTALLSLDDAGSEMGFSVSGSEDELNVMNDKAAELGSQFSDRLKKSSDLQALAPMIGKDKLAAMTTTVLGGGKAQIGDMLHADDYDGGFLFNDRTDTKDGKGKGARMDNWQQFDKFKTAISSPESAQKIASMDGSKEALASMDAQIKSMESARADGRNVMVDAQGNEKEFNEQTVNEYKAAAENLRKAIDQMAGSQTVGTMTVTKLEVTGDFNSEKK